MQSLTRATLGSEFLKSLPGKMDACEPALNTEARRNFGPHIWTSPMDTHVDELDIIGTSFSTPSATLIGEATPPLAEDASKHENGKVPAPITMEARSGKRLRTGVEPTESGKRKKTEDKKTVGSLS